jgi:hypothetical protein
MASPTLVAGCTRHWQEHERELLVALAADAGLTRQALGLTADETEALALAEAETAFRFLREGLTSAGNVSDTTP